MWWTWRVFSYKFRLNSFYFNFNMLLEGIYILDLYNVINYNTKRRTRKKLRIEMLKKWQYCYCCFLYIVFYIKICYNNTCYNSNGCWNYNYNFRRVLKCQISNGRKLRRSANDYTFAGICGGLGEFTHINSAIFRILFILLILKTPVGFLLYLLLWIALPTDEES